jgi:hypothetical protein
MRGRVTFLLVGLASASIWTTTAEAQSLTVNGGGAATVRPANDFANDVIGDPWDFEQRSDFTYMFSDDGTGASAFQNVPEIADGLLRGVARTGTINVKMLFEGVGGAMNQVAKTGVRYPINANYFNRVSFRMKRSVAVNTSPENDVISVQWLRQMDGNGGIRHAAAHGAFGGDSFANNSPQADQGKTTYHIYTLDPDQGPVRTGTWDGIVGGLTVRLGTNAALAGATIELDWVRLTRRGEVSANLAWSGFGGRVTLTASNAATGDTIQIYPSGGTDFAASGSYAWDYGFLPAGVWVITAKAGAQQKTATLTIDPAPLVTINEPDASGGRDYATTTFGDAWDLTNPQDVTRYGQLYQIPLNAFSESGLDGVTGGTDPFVQFMGFRPGPKIPSSTYHRLTFTIQHDHPELMARDVSAGPFLGGHVVRAIWNRNNVFQETQDIFVTDGIAETFSMDLSALQNTTTEIEPPTRVLWANGDIDQLRIDINESPAPRAFRLNNVKLATDDAPNGNGFFLIKWSVSDATFSRQIAGGNGADAKVSLYYDTDLNPSNMTLIASNINATTFQYAWDVSGLQAGVPYYVYIVITDNAGYSQGRYSGGPVVLPSAFPAGLRTDSNSNGLPDQWEGEHSVTAANTDTDGDGLTNLQEYQAGTDPRVSNVWNLSEGATGFFTQRLALANPGASEATVTVKYLRSGGKPPIVRDYAVLPFGRLTINVNDIAGFLQEDVSAVITSVSGGVIAERTMFWGDLWWGGHTGKAIQQARTEWFLAEGASNGLFSTFILLANATGSTANVTLTFLREGASPVSVGLPVGAESRWTVDTSTIHELDGFSFSTRINSDAPISVERSMYLKSTNRPFEGGTEAAAVAEAKTDWFLAEGQTSGQFQEFVLLANPNNQATNATLRYLMPNRAPTSKVLTLPGNSRTTIEVGDENMTPGVHNTDVSIEIKAQDPIVVERAMYWPTGGPWTDGHASVGVNSLGTIWALAEGETGGSRGFESYILFANPSNANANVRLTFLREGGRPPVSEDFTVPANQRLTRSAGEFVARGLMQSSEKFGVLVQSLNDVPIVIERAMYWNGGGEFWGAGTGETGFKLK